MTAHILNPMKNQNQFKNGDKDKYYRLNKQINLACKETKEKWLVNQCEEVEQLKKQYKSREMHHKVKELTSKEHKKESKWMHKGQKHKYTIYPRGKVAARWVEYIMELYEDHRGANT